jgi:hypothetical protein
MSKGEAFFSVPVRLVVHLTCNPDALLGSLEISEMFGCDRKHLPQRLRPAIESGAIRITQHPSKRFGKAYGIGPALAGVRERAMAEADAQ